jgi:hypothetical protein
MNVTGLDAVIIFSVQPMAIIVGLNASVDNTCTNGMKCTRKEGKFKHMKFHVRNEGLPVEFSTDVSLILIE